MYIHSFRLIAPRKLLEAQLFNQQYQNYEDIPNVQDRLRWCRHHMGLMQKEVAELIGITRGHYVDFEVGYVDHYPKEIVDKLAELCQVPVDDLLDDYNRFLYKGQGKLIREYRESLGLKKKQFARLIKLDPGTLRTGRVEFKYLPMPYENEPLEIWKNYLECLRNSSGNTERIVNRLEKTKEIFQKRGEKDFKEISPYLEYDLPYEGITFDAPLKKWKNWIEYMGSRKGISVEAKLDDFYFALDNIATKKCTVSSPAQYQKITQNPKFQKISDMMKEQYFKFSDNPNKEKVWDLFVEKTMKGFTEHTT